MALKPLQTNIKIDDIKNTKQTNKKGSFENSKSLENNGINSKINHQKKEISDKIVQNKENLQKKEEKKENDLLKIYEIESNEIDEELKESHNLFVEALNILMDNKDEEEKDNESEIKDKLTDVIKLITEIKNENQKILKRNKEQEVEIKNLNKELKDVKEELENQKNVIKELKKKLNVEESEQ